jgi:hypothetical protein
MEELSPNSLYVRIGPAMDVYVQKQRWWRFASCDFKGWPKELLFA